MQQEFDYMQESIGTLVLLPRWHAITAHTLDIASVPTSHPHSGLGDLHKFFVGFDSISNYQAVTWPSQFIGIGLLQCSKRSS